MLQNFQFYFDLIFNGADKYLLSDFLGNKELLNNGFEYLKDYEYYLKDEMIVDDVEPIFVMTIITKEKFLVEKFKSKKKLLLDEVRVKLNVFDSDKKRTFLIEFFNEIYNVYKKSLNTELNHQELIRAEMSELINDLKLLYKESIINHKLFAKIESLEKINIGNFFGLKPYLKKSFLTDLYDVCVNLFLIDDEEIFEEEFIEIFICSKPNPKLKIRFIEKNYPIVYFLESIQPFFNNFSFTSIEQSKNFYNKQNKLLTATDLSSTKSRNKNISLSIIFKIDSEINALKVEHLE